MVMQMKMIAVDPGAITDTPQPEAKLWVEGRNQIMVGGPDLVMMAPNLANTDAIGAGARLVKAY